MESLRRRTLFIVILATFSMSANAISYYNQLIGHIHQNPHVRSTSLTAIQCGDPVTVVDNKAAVYSEEWLYVSFGEDKGYVLRKYLSNSRPEKCFRAKYPKFYEMLGLDLKEIYYWGRLYDQFITGESTIK